MFEDLQDNNMNERDFLELGVSQYNFLKNDEWYARYPWNRDRKLSLQYVARYNDFRND